MTPMEPIDPRIRERRIEVARRQGRRRLYVLASVVVMVGLWASGFGLAHSSLLSVNQVSVVGSVHTPVSTVIRRAALDGHPPMIDVDSDGAARRLEALPWVLGAQVAKHWPSLVVVRITERVPVAQVLLAPTPASSRWVLVDRTGRVLASSTRETPGEIALVGVDGAGRPGTTLRRVFLPALEVAAELPAEVRPKLTAVGVTEAGIVLTLVPSGTAELGSATNLSRKLSALLTVLSRVDLTGLRTLDLRVPKAPVLTRG